MHDFIPAGFFVLRTPLLPFDELLSWSAGLEASPALESSIRLEEMLARDRAGLRARLFEIVARPELRDALFVASSDLDRAFDVWVNAPETERGQGIERALVRYFERMAGRSTPFGLCAGCSIGVMADETYLVVEKREKYQRYTRLAMDYLFALTEALQRNPALRKVFSYRPNSTLYRTAGRVRYVASRRQDKERSFHLVTTAEGEYLGATLVRAEKGATLGALAAALVEDEVTLVEAEEYINELIENQILVASLPLPVTGPEPISPLIEELRQHSETLHVAEMLDQARATLAAIDAKGLGVAPERYRAVARLLEQVPIEVESPSLFHVDMFKPGCHATLGKGVLAEIVRGVEVLHRLSRPVGQEELTRFRDNFLKRYEMREIPLAEALDEEIGVGFGTGHEATPLLQGLHFPSQPDETTSWRVREKILLRKLSEALQAGAREIILTPSDLEKLAMVNPLPLPDSFAVIATIAAPSEAALARGNFHLLLEGGSGPSGARLLGRFCHADGELQCQMEKYLRAEEALQPDAVFAEIVHLPEGRFGNFICRPILRDYEIPYLCGAGVPMCQQVAIADLTVSVRDNRITLRSTRLGREVIPRMTNPHNYRLSHLGVYEFLCTLQHQNVVEKVFWNWGALADAPFLPRVAMGRLVLSRAQWHVSKEELERFMKPHGVALFQSVQSWRLERGLPRWIVIADADNVLPTDLNNVLSIETFVHLVRSREEATLMEMFPGPDELCARGPEGRFVHELVVPFLRTSKTGEVALKGTNQLKRFNPPNHSSPLGRLRTFPAGSEWLFVKLYTGTATADRVLCEIVAPLVREVLDSGAADEWFFIRYGDPDWHLRLRFHGTPERLHADVLPTLQAALFPLMNDGRLWRFQLDTYEREVERYGGGDGIELAERIFHADSEAVMEIMKLLEPADEGLAERWQLTLRGIDALLTDFAFDSATKCGLLLQRANSLAEKISVANKSLRDELSRKFRKERKSLEKLLDRARDDETALAPGLDIFGRRSQRIAPIVEELKACEKAGRLSVPLRDFAMGCVHMHANRLLRSAHHEQESVIYDFLSRIYKSQSARE